MSIISNTKELIELAKKGLTVELQIRLIQMQEQELELREEIVLLKTTLSEIEEKNKVNDSLELKEGMYFQGENRMCQLCWDSDGKLINLQSSDIEGTDEFERTYYVSTYFHCLRCKSNYGT